jgi:hypothetical protein
MLLFLLLSWLLSDADVLQFAEAALDRLADNSADNQLAVDAARVSLSVACRPAAVPYDTALL